MNRVRVTALVVIASAAMTTNAYAYIDPVTGSFVIQGIAAGFAGAMVAFRSLRQKVFALITGKAKQSHDTAGPTRHDP